MKTGSLGFYLENLVPGVVILVCLVILLAPFPPDQFLKTAPPSGSVIELILKSEFLVSTVFLSVAYVLGLISAMLSRAVVDPLSEWFPRPFVLAHFAHSGLGTLEDNLEYLDSTFTFPSLNKGQSIRRADARGAWNKVYRAVLAQVRSGSGSSEVERRREQGRLVRNLASPLVLSWLAVCRLGPVAIPWWLAAVIALILFVFVVFLYAYAEYFSFAEASLQLKLAVTEMKAKEPNQRPVPTPLSARVIGASGAFVAGVLLGWSARPSRRG
jgi:hypothetical protein